MGALSTTVTLQDLAKRMDANGKIDAIVELLTEQNEILLDMQWKEGNQTNGEKTTVRTGLPTATWRMLNYGVQNSKSTTAQVVDSCGMLEAYAEVDKALADANNNSAEFRTSEDRSFLEAMNIEMSSTLFYGDSSKTPAKFIGLAPRFSKLSGAQTSANIINASGSSACTSVWLICWGPNTVYGIYPKGSKAGFTHQDLGEQTLLDAAGGKYQGYRTHYKWDAGLTVRDWRFVVRIANIDTSALTKNAATGADLIDLMVQALETVPNLTTGRPVFYCNKTVRSFLRRQTTNKSNVHLSMSEVAGKKVLTFDEVPVRRCDEITNSETVVS